MSQGYQSLTDKEKQTLRLLLVGYDAKSMARHLDLSVHTVNERLRDARRKLAVSSSREAARLLHETEAAIHGQPTPESLGDKALGEAGPGAPMPSPTPSDGHRRIPRRTATLFGGVFIMSLILAALALSLAAPSKQPPAAAPAPATKSAASPSADSREGVAAARQWLALVDAGRWTDSWRETGSSFRQLNTVDVWTQVSQDVRVPLGAASNRVLTGTEDVPAPPAGYLMVRFRTDFATKSGATETLTLEREAGVWRVTGYIIE